MAVIQLPPNSSGTRLRNIAGGVDSGAADAQEIVTLATAAGVLVDPATEVTLAAILVELNQKLEPGNAVALAAGTLTNLENLTADVKRGLTDYEARLDYDALSNLIYSGKAANGTATTATTWTIQKLSYTGANLTRVQVLSGLAWDSRVTAPW